MDVLPNMKAGGYEQVVFCHEPSCDYFGIIVIHDTKLGPALGGTRFWHYKSTEEAIAHALRLARGMTYKEAMIRETLATSPRATTSASSSFTTPSSGRRWAAPGSGTTRAPRRPSPTRSGWHGG